MHLQECAFSHSSWCENLKYVFRPGCQLRIFSQSLMRYVSEKVTSRTVILQTNVIIHVIISVEFLGKRASPCQSLYGAS